MAGTRGQDNAQTLETAKGDVLVDQPEQRDAAAVPTSDRVQNILSGPGQGPSATGNGHGHGGRRGNELDFGSGEHQEQGNTGAKAEHADKKHDEPQSSRNPTDPLFKFELTHGDIVMLSGDYFDPRDKNERGEPVADSLFKLAGKPSKNLGAEVGTQDEILYAIKDAVPADPRFAKGGIWEHVKFSPDVKATVDARYLQLAAHNFEHFVNPDGKGGGPKSGNRHSAGGSYRALHEQAIHEAHRAQSTGKSIDEAMAHEAAAEHFLTDSFSAGHIRTPRESIATYWNGKYPLFFENLKKTIARDVAIYVNKHDDNITTDVLSVRDFHERILALHGV